MESARRHAAATFTAADDGSIAPPFGQSVFRVSSIFTDSSSSDSSSGLQRSNGNPLTASPTEGGEVTLHPPAPRKHFDEDEADPQLSIKFALMLLLTVTGEAVMASSHSLL